MNMKNLILGAALLSGATAYAAPTKYIVKLKEGANPKSISLFSMKSVQDVTPVRASFGKFYSLKAEGLSQKSVSLLAADPNIEYIEESQTYSIGPVAMNKEVINDAKYSDQWGLKNTGRNSGGWFSRGKEGEDVNAEKAWGITKGDRALKIAVIDTGVDYTHQDLKANMWTNELEANGIEGVDDDGNGYIDDIHGYDFANDDGDPQDGHGHGTHCAGNIGAKHDRSGVRGVMDNVQMVGIKFLTDSGSGDTQDAIESIEYAIAVGVDLMSNSWGGGGFSQALKDAIQAANDAGIVFVAAAGNSRRDNDTTDSYPANYEIENVISVGAMDGSGKRSSFSNYGAEKVHVFAPGSNIMSTVPGNRYQKMSGTSMATPLASGVIGLLMAENPNLTPMEIRDRVEATAVRNGLVDQYTRSGRIDAERLLLNTVN
ncbi:MAG: subtilase [Halobacteriovoraceae bacterium]|nr:subtilase [Halobacteriovoraceae bacterium]|tara:strand:+ start:118075 stop:119361 length:1287 start_codon:yes stop_codon:yes gene_type:complete